MMNIEDIIKIIPHRYPMLLVDRILEVEDGKRIVGIKNVTANEPFFAGHFPDRPVMPGVLVIEAMAQVGAVLLLANVPQRDNKLVYFIGIDNARFRKPVRPGDQIKFEVKVLNLRASSCKMRGEAFVNGELVAEAEFMSVLVNKDKA